MKKYKKFYLLHFIFLINISCDIKFPEEWDQPNWNLPINFPLQSETYFFSGLIDSNTILLDNDSTLYILFREDTLKGPDGRLLGIDSTFEDYFEISGMNAPNIEEFVLDQIEIQSFDTSFNASLNLNYFDYDFSVFDCFPDVILDGDTLSENFTETIYNAQSINVFNSIDSITVIDGLFSVFILNELPFDITKVKIDMYTSNQPIWQVEIDNISENESESRLRIISEIDPLVLKETIDFKYEIYIEPQIGNDNCGLNTTGWGLDGNYDRSLFVNFDLSFDRFGSIAGNINPIGDTTYYQINIPNPENILISGGLLSNNNDYNKLSFGLNNNLFTDVEIGIKILELFEYDSSSQDWLNNFDWNNLLESGNSREHTLNLKNSILRSTDGIENSISNLNMAFSLFVPSQDIEIEISPSVPYSFSINEISIYPFKFDYVNAMFQELNFSSPSIEINNIPKGFQGFKFSDVNLDLNIYNQIGVPIVLDMFISGVNNGNETHVPLIDSIFYPSLKNGYEIGDVVKSNIRMSGSYQYSTWYDKNNNIIRQDTIKIETSFLDLMDFAPEEIIFGGTTVLNGNGTLAPQTYIWGDFELNIPLSFIFEDGMNIVPNFTTDIAEMNDETKQQINENLVSAELHLNVENHSALSLVLSLLISTRPDYFPHYFDKFISGSLVTNQSIIEEYSDTDYEFLSNLNVNRVEIDVVSNDQQLIDRVIFKDENLNIIFWIGRIANIIIPEAEEVNQVNGHVIQSGFYDNKIKLSSEKMEWLTSNENRFSRPLIEFAQTGDSPRTLRSSDYIKISTYISVILETGQN